MNWSSAVTWFAAVLAAARRPRFESTDRGDMGTAFGLDDSIAPFDPSRLDGDEPASEAVSGWHRRLVRRPHP